jgi:isopentenyl-diphosphate delta-isomerase type 2
MTGGSEEGFTANKELAKAAQAAGIPVGMGSFRILFDEPALFDHFYLRAFARDVPVIGNIGSVQIRDMDHKTLFEMVKRLELDALAVHMNPGQEIYQPGGDTDFRGIRDAFSRLCESCPVPVIAKETGFGVSPALIGELLGRGAAYVDIAGAGGTNWVNVESYRLSGEWAGSAADFRDWGLPTALVLAAAGDCGGRLIASGGIRSGMDAAKSVALGALLAGTALPFIRAVKSGGAEAVESLIASYSRTIRSAMLLTGSANTAALREAPRWYSADFTADLESFTEALVKK